MNADIVHRPSSLKPGLFRGKRVLVTGAGGFIGSNLCVRLLREEADLCALSRRPLAESIPNLQTVQLDAADVDRFAGLMRELKPHYLFHLAGYVQGGRGLEQVRPAFIGNLVTTLNSLSMAAELGCERVILTGSQDEPNRNEVSATGFVPPSPYAAAKFAGNCYARMFHELYQLPVSVARIFMAYGPGQRDLKKLIPYVILSVLSGQAPKLSSGSRPMDWIYVEDVVEALVRVAQHPAANGKTIELGTGVPNTAREAAQKLVELMHSPLALELGALPDRQLERGRFADTDETHSLIGWRAAVSFDEGLRQTIDWYRSQFKAGRLRL